LLTTRVVSHTCLLVSRIEVPVVLASCFSPHPTFALAPFPLPFDPPWFLFHGLLGAPNPGPKPRANLQNCFHTTEPPEIHPTFSALTFSLQFRFNCNSFHHQTSFLFLFGGLYLHVAFPRSLPGSEKPIARRRGPNSPWFFPPISGLRSLLSGPRFPSGRLSLFFPYLLFPEEVFSTNITLTIPFLTSLSQFPFPWGRGPSGNSFGPLSHYFFGKTCGRNLGVIWKFLSLHGEFRAGGFPPFSPPPTPTLSVEDIETPIGPKKFSVFPPPFILLSLFPFYSLWSMNPPGPRFFRVPL